MIIFIGRHPVEVVWVPVLTREGLREMARQNRGQR